MSSLRILLLEDVESDAELILYQLRKERTDFTHIRVWKPEEFARALGAFKPDVIIADHSMPQFTGIDAFRVLKKFEISIPFILVTGTVSEDLLVQCMKEGMDDYVLKHNLLRLPAAIQNVVNRKKLEEEKERIRKLNMQLKSTSEKLEAANREIESKNKDLLDSINYARRIQEAILPENENLLRYFPESFIFYRPKDIVSGDFYWFHPYEDKLLLAVADCTGHGIPGAFMSMIGHNLLNEIVSVKDITQPPEVLARLHRGLRKVLRQDKGNKGIFDGMDISFCTIDIVKKKLEFAGANRPLYLLRNKVLKEIKGDKNSAGGVYSESNLAYTGHSIDLRAGDRLYLFTDGYVDQFGGEENKKIMARRFRELIIKIQNFKMKQQEEMLENFMIQWKSGTEQIDDVLVIGLEVV